MAHIIQNHTINISNTSSVNCSVFPGLKWKSLTDNNLMNYFEFLLLSNGEHQCPFMRAPPAGHNSKNTHSVKIWL